MYFYEIAYTNILHAILIHLPGSLGFFAIYNNNHINNHSNNNHNNIFMYNPITSYIFIIWLSLIIICLLYLIYYDFYVSYKIKVLNNNIKNLKIDFINKIK